MNATQNTGTQHNAPRPLLIGPRCIRYRHIALQVWLGEHARARRDAPAPAASKPAFRA
jgi:hypothetical protein